jgi:Type IV secretory system Conjugative DNA transfer
MSQRPADQHAPSIPARPEPTPVAQTTLNSHYVDNTAKRQAKHEPLFGESETTSLFLGWEDDARASAFGFGTGGSKKRARTQPILYQGDSHLMTIAPTGAGKGVGVIIPNLLRYTGTVIAIDPKGGELPGHRPPPARNGTEDRRARSVPRRHEQERLAQSARPIHAAALDHGMRRGDALLAHVGRA